MIICQAKSVCPLIETLSFGSDITYRCNQTHLVFNEVNYEGLNWKFDDETDQCDQNGVQTTTVNQCKLTRMRKDYLRVPFKSLENYERACVYCRINYKSMMPVITAAQTDEIDRTVYVFNITATALEPNESFEILWAKRVHASFRHSYNFWFTRGCVDDTAKILVHNRHSIVFAVDDVVIRRVEFIIRRCQKSCRQYDRCLKDQFLKEIDSNSFDIPDRIEKISCDEYCLRGLQSPPSRSAMTHRPRIKSSTHRPVIQTPTYSKDKLKYLVISVFVSVAILLMSLILLCCLIIKLKKREPAYAKTNITEPHEHK